MIALEKPVRRVTRGALSDAYGSDRGRKLVASLEAGDLLVIRPIGTRRPETISLFDVYHYALMSRVNCLRLEKAREKKAKLAERRKAHHNAANLAHWPHVDNFAKARQAAWDLARGKFIMWASSGSGRSAGRRRRSNRESTL